MSENENANNDKDDIPVFLHNQNHKFAHMMLSQGDTRSDK
jgi:hypothetical protein